MKVIAIIWLAIQVIAIAFGYAICYWQGYYESEKGLFFLFAISPLIELSLLFISLLGLFSLLILSLLRKRHPLWMTLAFTTFFAVIFISWKMPSQGSMLVYGLRNRVMHDYTLDNLRHFAREVNQGISFKSNSTFGKWINHGDLSLLNDSEKNFYTHEKQKYPFTHWMEDDRGFGGPSVASRNDGVIEFEWGGALEGHWGCSISIDGSKNDPDPAIFKTLRVSDDIYFYFD